ncbi:chitinase-3-like protein 1 isoform X2 [Hemicordylus capensis]|uniref:chitinase-3-like protein 1 isoform X2 n=1 Tax=Hemicordylus capensis TaxID=884348 RepID=UPI002303AE47|nr:chitinase-3-like protein 1 isoform X2 [Hemicordylus capensis]
MRQLSILAVGVVALICLQCVSSFKLVCYFTNWSQYRESSGRFLSGDTDPNLCTHIIYAFANIKDNQLVHTEWNDDTTYADVNNLKRSNPNLKTLLSVGGYLLGAEPFSNLTSPRRRSDFIISAMQFLRTKNFDGLDLAWHSPKYSDKSRLADLVKDLSIQFKHEAQDQRKAKLILSVAVPAGKEKIDTGYDITTISEYADFLNFLTFDFHGSWESHTGHLSPLQKGKTDTGSASYYNVDYAVKYLMGKGASAEKIIMGLPTYGRTFTLSSSLTTVGAPTSGGGTSGEYTKEPGMRAYYEICHFNVGATKEWIEEQAVPYSYKGNQWVGYEDVTSIQKKVQYMKNNRLGGVMIWTLDLDDFSGSFCNQGKYPLVGAAKTELEKQPFFSKGQK